MTGGIDPAHASRCHGSAAFVRGQIAAKLVDHLVKGSEKIRFHPGFKQAGKVVGVLGKQQPATGRYFETAPGVGVAVELREETQRDLSAAKRPELRRRRRRLIRRRPRLQCRDRSSR